MGAKDKVLKLVTGWEAIETILQCLFIGIWQLFKVTAKRIWKGHRRKVSKTVPTVEMSVDSAIGTHCYVKVMGVKYHYVSTGPKTGQVTLILADAPDRGNLWCPSWSRTVRRLADSGRHVITLDLRGTGGSEGGSRTELSPPKAVKELFSLLQAFGVSKTRPADIIGFGVGGMLTWYLVHCHSPVIAKFVVVGAPHPNLYWTHPPAPFCKGVLHFIQWPHFPESWLAEGELHDAENGWSSSRACDWTGALNYVRGAAWWRVCPGRQTAAPALLVGGRHSAAELVTSAQYCATSTLRLVDHPSPTDLELQNIVMEFLIEKDKQLTEAEPRGLMGRVLGAVAGRGRELTSKLPSLTA